jgi:hypothetical protein
MLLTGFLSRRELATLRGLRSRQARSRLTRAPDATELAGEIVSTELPLAETGVGEDRRR